MRSSSPSISTCRPNASRVVQGDTDLVATGAGTGGSSSITCGGASVDSAARKLAANLKALAAHELEASEADLEIADGQVRIAGTDRAVSFAGSRHRRGRRRDLLAVKDSVGPPQPTYPNGTHIAEVEIDPDTGHVDILAYVIVDDFGVTLNPLLLAGQVHGGAVQGIGQALMENTVYDANSGQLITASLHGLRAAAGRGRAFVHVRDPQRAAAPPIRSASRARARPAPSGPRPRS